MNSVESLSVSLHTRPVSILLSFIFDALVQHSIQS